MSQSETPRRDETWLGRARDRVAWTLASGALSIATPWYRGMLKGLIIAGMKDAARASLADPPKLNPDWPGAVGGIEQENRE
jgi:hypothetical protein